MGPEAIHQICASSHTPTWTKVVGAPFASDAQGHTDRGNPLYGRSASSRRASVVHSRGPAPAQGADFEGAHGVGLPPESVVFVCPTDNLIPATIRKFVPSLDVECERYAEGAGNDLAAIGTRKGKSKICLEKRCRKIQPRHPIVHHEFRKKRRGKSSRQKP